MQRKLFLTSFIYIIIAFSTFSFAHAAKDLCVGNSSATLNWSWTNSPTGCTANFDNALCSFNVPANLPGSSSDAKAISIPGGTPAFTCTANLNCGGAVQSSDSLTWDPNKTWNGTACVAAGPPATAPTNVSINIDPSSGWADESFTVNYSANNSPTWYQWGRDDVGQGAAPGSPFSAQASDYGWTHGNASYQGVQGRHAINVIAGNTGGDTGWGFYAYYTVKADCVAGYYRSGGACAQCTGGNYCTGNQVQTPCPGATPLSPNGSTNVGQCYAATIPECLNGVPANATMCSGDDTGLSVDTFRTVVYSCSPATKCEYRCQPSYYKSGNSCPLCDAGNYCPGGIDPSIQCPIGSYCPSGASSPTPCPGGQTSAAGSTNSGQCYLPAGDTCGPLANTYQVAEPIGSNACSSGALNSSSPANTSDNWRWSCGSLTCSAIKPGCNVTKDTNYSGTNPANNYNCALTCANGATGDYPVCTTPPSISSFTNSGPITSGNTATLTWGNVTGGGVVTCSINNGIGAATPLSGGVRTTAALAVTTTYTITCSNAGGTDTDTTTVTVSGGGGVCGTANNGSALSSQPASDPARCQSGGYSNSADTADYWKWSCGSASCQVAKLCSSTQYWNGSSCTACGDTGCNSCTASVLAPTSGCVCNNTVGTPSACTPGPVNGVCSATYWDCTQGVATDQSNTATDWTWKCQGLNGGNTPNCSTPIVASSCGTSNNTIQPSQPTTDPERCAIGATYSNLADTNAWYRWSCDASDCTAYKRGCRVTTDSAYVGQPPIYPDNDDKCSGLCTNGNNDYPACVTPYAGLADLTAGNVTPAVATAGMIQPFHSTISNIGIEKNPGAVPFFNFFQYSTQPNGGGTITDVPIAIPAGYVLGPGGTAFYQQSFAFPVSGTFYIRMCTDKKDSGDGGVVAESNEGNNCSPAWSTITVAGPCANNATNFPACNTCPLGDSYWDGSSCTPCGATGCTSCTATIASPTDNCVCNNGNAPGACTAPVCAPPSVWGTTKCVNPQVDSFSVSGQNYYTAPEALIFQCSGSTHYRITKDGVAWVGSTLLTPTPISTQTVTPDAGSATYQVFCINEGIEDASTPTPYTSAAPTDSRPSIDAYPKTINSGGKTTLSWTIVRPRIQAPLCKITASPVCSNGTCTAAETDAIDNPVTGIKNILLTEKVDGTDPGRRTITQAVSTKAVGQSGVNAKAFDKKTLALKYTTDFTVDCNGTKATTRIRVANSSER